MAFAFQCLRPDRDFEADRDMIGNAIGELRAWQIAIARRPAFEQGIRSGGVSSS